MLPAEKPIKHIENYVLFNTILDETSKGNIHKAENKSLFYEVLVISKEKFQGNITLLDEMLIDIRKLKQIDHPNILKFGNLVETQNTYYLTSEITKEGTLYDYIATKTRLSENEALEIFIQIFDGYKEFLRKNILHANLTSKSIYKSKRLFKISSLFMKENQKNFSNSYKLSYISGEGLEKDTIDQTYDSWSLGMIFCEMVFGQTPIKAQNKQELQKGLDNLSETLNNLSKTHQISNECLQFIKGFLNKEVKKRLYWNDIMQHSFMKMNKERIEIYLLDNLMDNIFIVKKKKNIIDELINDKLSILTKEILEEFEKSKEDYGYYCKIYKKILICEGLFSKIPRRVSMERKISMEDENIDENIKQVNIPLSLSDIEKYMIRSTSLSPRKAHKKTNSSDLMSLSPTKISLEESKSIEDDNYPNFEQKSPNEKDEVNEKDKNNRFEAKNYINLQKINSEYKKSKQRKLSVILENSIEVSTVLPKEENNGIEEILKEMVFYYMHEKEMIEFLIHVSFECEKESIDLINIYAIVKFALIRLKALIENIQKKNNIFHLLYWDQLVVSSLYKNLGTLIEEDKALYISFLSKICKRANSIKDSEGLIKKEFINEDLNLNIEAFIKTMINVMVLGYELLSKKAKSFEDQNKSLSLKYAKLAYKLIFIAKMGKELNYQAFDIGINFDISLFKEKLMNMSLLEISSLAFRLKKEI